SSMARKLGRKTDARMALIRNLTTDLIIHERIETTEAKAKELKSAVEKMITLAKRGDLHARRQAAAFLYNKEANEDDSAKNFSMKLLHAMKTDKAVTLV